VRPTGWVRGARAFFHLGWGWGGGDPNPGWGGGGEARFPASIQTCPGAYPTSYTLGTGSLFRGQAAGA